MALTINTNIKNEANGYSLDALQVKGGYVVVANEEERDAIPAATKVNGTTIYQVDVGKEFRWNGSEWLEASGLNIQNGTATNSLIQKYPDGKPNSALKDGTIAFGQNSTANQKFDIAIGGGAVAGFAYKNDFNAFYYDFENKKPLHDGQGLNAQGEVLDFTGNTYENSFGWNRSFGEGTIARGRSAVAFQNGQALGLRTTAFGNSQATGDNAFSTGNSTGAIGPNTFTQGNNTVAEYDNQAAFGRFNDNKEENIFEVGVGSGEPDEIGLPETKNGFAVLRDGRAKVLAAPKDDDDVVRKGDVTAALALNIENGVGTSSIRQPADPKYNGVIKAATKNPYAKALYPELTDSEPIGAIGDYAASFGGNSSVQAKRGIGGGTSSVTKGAYSQSLGDNTVTTPNASDSTAIGYQTTTDAPAAFAHGSYTVVMSKKYVEGMFDPSVEPGQGGSGQPTEPGTTPTDTLEMDTRRGEAASAGGFNSYSSGFAAQVDGISNVADGHISKASGRSNRAWSYLSKVDGYQSVVKPDDTDTDATGEGSWANGKDIQIIGAKYAYAGGEGGRTTKVADNSFSYGKGLVTETSEQAVFGAYNEGESDSIFIVGTGTSDSAKDRKTAFRILKSGQVLIKDKPTNGSAPIRLIDFTSDYFVNSKAETSKLALKANDFSDDGSIKSNFDDQSKRIKALEQINAGTRLSNLELTTNSMNTTIHELADNKQATLVSGTNIKTINGNSLLGSGNLVIESGGGDVTAAGDNTFTGTNKFSNPVEAVNGYTLHDLDLSDSNKTRYCWSYISYQHNNKVLFLDFPGDKEEGSYTIATTDDIPNASTFATLAGDNVFTKNVTFQSYQPRARYGINCGTEESSSTLYDNKYIKITDEDKVSLLELPQTNSAAATKLATVNDIPVANSGTGTTALTSLKIGDTVYSISSGSGDVTLTGNNTFTGSNTFNKQVVIGKDSGSLRVSDEDLSGMYSELSYQGLFIKYPSSNLSVDISTSNMQYQDLTNRKTFTLGPNYVQAVVKDDNDITVANTTLAFSEMTSGNAITVTMPSESGTLALTTGNVFTNENTFNADTKFKDNISIYDVKNPDTLIATLSTKVDKTGDTRLPLMEMSYESQASHNGKYPLFDFYQYGIGTENSIGVTNFKDSSLAGGDDVFNSVVISSRGAIRYIEYDTHDDNSEKLVVKYALPHKDVTGNYTLATTDDVKSYHHLVSFACWSSDDNDVEADICISFYTSDSTQITTEELLKAHLTKLGCVDVNNFYPISTHRGEYVSTYWSGIFNDNGTLKVVSEYDKGGAIPITINTSRSMTDSAVSV